MIFTANTAAKIIPKLLLSAGVSAGLLAVLIHFTLSSADATVWSSLVNILHSFSLVYALVYLGASLIRTLLQSLRYRILLNTSESQIPSLFHIFLVTLSRNMFVDMLPARLGELSYVAMLNRGCQVSGESCISSLAISFVFDLIGLAVLLFLLILFQVIGGDFQSWMVGVLIVLTILIVFILLLLYPAVRITNVMISRILWMQRGLPGKFSDLLFRIQTALQDTRTGGVTGRVLTLSIGIRLAKYFGLYCLFIGIVSVQFPEMGTSITTVFPALVSAEAGASLPVPAFMGFGTYEAGGTLALTALGASTSTSLVVMLAIHVVSQIIDYLLGGLGLLLFIFNTSPKTAISHAKQRFSWRIRALVVGLLALTLLFLAYEMRAVKKRGSLNAPDQGKAISSLVVSGDDILKQVDGFLVWSSNRAGNHDIYLRSFPDGSTKQLTTHPHTEYYPRISPDGQQIVFARSHEPWVSQRNIYAWDIWLLDLNSGRQQLLAKNGNVPTWSPHGTSVYFQRNGNQVIELNVKTKKEHILFQSGINVQVPPKTQLQTPSISGKGKMAVTLRNTMRATSVVDRDGTVHKTGNGCQITWGADDRYLIKIDEGKMENAIYKIDPRTFGAEIWFDAPGKFSHEYFPMVANTGDVLVYGASADGHEHDSADYEIFLWVIGTPESQVARITYHTGNDCWPDIYMQELRRTDSSLK